MVLTIGFLKINKYLFIIVFVSNNILISSSDTPVNFLLISWLKINSLHLKTTASPNRSSSLSSSQMTSHTSSECIISIHSPFYSISKSKYKLDWLLFCIEAKTKIHSSKRVNPIIHHPSLFFWYRSFFIEKVAIGFLNMKSKLSWFFSLFV